MSEHLRIELDANKAATPGTYDHSKFPHPLVTCDYDSDGNLYAVEIFGPLAEKISNLVEVAVAYAEDVLTGSQKDPS